LHRANENAVPHLVGGIHPKSSSDSNGLALERKVSARRESRRTLAGVEDLKLLSSKVS
jgi:hypothetical protein